MKCSHCDSPMGETARYCCFCGNPLGGNGFAQRLAHAYMQELSGDLDAATSEYEALVASTTDARHSAAVLKHLGNLHFRRGHLRRARTHLERATSLEPAHAALWHDLGVVAYHMADFDTSIKAFRAALARDADLHLAYFWLGNALYHRGQLDAAAETFRTLVERYPNFAVARFHLAVIYACQGSSAQADEEFRRVLASDPEDAAARSYLEGTSKVR